MFSKLLDNKKLMAAIVVLITTMLGLDQVSDHYTIEAKQPDVTVEVTIPEPHIIETPHKHTNWLPTIKSECERINAEGYNVHLDEFHGGS